ncbi:hypothetical protein Peur_005235 [Populus x canadensis]
MHGEAETIAVIIDSAAEAANELQKVYDSHTPFNFTIPLFDNGIEGGGLRASSSYSHETDDHDHSNNKAVHTLQDKLLSLKRVLTGDKHEEVESQNRLLD